ncbi:MAG: galactokinase [Blastocatellia bacterium]
MYTVIHGSTLGLADVESFLQTLNSMEQDSATRGLFDPTAELIVARAPGRLDVMGGIADYSGSLVLEMPIREATFVALQRAVDSRLKIVSLQDDSGEALSFEMPLADFEQAGEPVNYEAARSYFERNSANHWAAYVAGVFLVLMRECGVHFTGGARLLIASRVPQGKGVSSSASLEVATMNAVAAAFDVALQPRETALLCQKVENLVAGAPCGVMDQMTSVCGEANQLLALLCQPAELQASVSIPDEIGFWGIDSGVRHAVTGADYSSVRVGAFMGYRIIAELAGFDVTRSSVTQITDARWNGYLANLTPSEFEQCYFAQLPERISGAEFLARYGGTTDVVTSVDPNCNYAVRVPTAHPIYEHHRVRLFAEFLDQISVTERESTTGSTGHTGESNQTLPDFPRDPSVPRGSTPATDLTEQRLECLGELMYQSHASYSACGLGSAATDRLVTLAREVGSVAGIYGAKITGGGSGGTVAVLARREAVSAIHRIAEQYAAETGHQPYIFSGSSPGGATFGYLRAEST